jgi:hypothetical protein
LGYWNYVSQRFGWSVAVIRLFCLVLSCPLYIFFLIYISYIFLISNSIYWLNILSWNPPRPMWYRSVIFCTLELEPPSGASQLTSY